MQTAFITGATGFLGTNIVRQLVENGVTVHAIRRETSDISELANLPVQWHIADVTQLNSLMAACPETVDVFFHAAADTSMWRRNDSQQTRINLEGTQNAIKTALAKRAKRFIHTSSIAAYGRHSQTITEATPQIGRRSISNYYRTKQQSEELVKKAVLEQQLPAVILNPCHLVGAPDVHNWSQMIQLVKTNALPGVPPGLGSFCDIQEVARAHIAAVEKGRIGENYILSGADLSFVDFVSHIGVMVGQDTPQKPIPSWVLALIGQLSVLWANVTRREPNITPEKAMIVSDQLKVSSAKAQSELGYVADIDVRKPLESCYQWMQETGRA